MNERDTRKIDKIQYVEKRKYFTLRSPDLKKMAEEGSSEAENELKRREKKKKSKAKKKNI